jgi:Gpi18-like mannosyltransferase
MVNNTIETISNNNTPHHGLPRRAIKYSLKCYLFIRLFSSIILLIMGLVAPPKVQLVDPNTRLISENMEHGGVFLKYFISPWYRWDTLHYISITENGYANNALETAWPPIYPLLIRLFSFCIHPTLLASLIVSNIAAIIALLLLYLIVTDIWDESIARDTLFWISIFPTAFYLVAGYTESLFLVFSLGCLYAFKKNKVWLAACLGSLTILTRLQGILLILPMAWDVAVTYFKQKERRFSPCLKYAIPIIFILASFMGFSFYVHFGLHAEWPWLMYQSYWNQSLSWPWAGIVGNFTSLTFRSVITEISPISRFYNLILVVGAIIFLIFARKKIPIFFLIYSAGMMLSLLATVDEHQLMVSASRYLITIFPIMVAFAVTIKKRVKPIFFFFFSASQMLLIILFYWWVWVA